MRSPRLSREGTRSYWKVVSKTMADRPANGPIWSFVTTGGTTPTLGAGDVNIYAANAPVIRGKWSRVADSTAAGGFRLSNPNAGAAKVTTPSATPADYFEATFKAVANTPYHLDSREGHQQQLQQRLGIRTVLTQRYAVELSHLADWFGLGRNDYHRGLQRLRPCGLGLERQHVCGDCCANLLRLRRRLERPSDRAGTGA